MTATTSQHFRFSMIAVAAITFLAAMPVVKAATLFAPGATFQVQASGAPDTYTENVALTPGTTLIDGGAVSLTIGVVPATGDSQWLTFDYRTTSGTSMGHAGQYWSISEAGLNAAIPVTFTAAYLQFTHDGTALVPTGNIFGGYGFESNPVPGQTGTGWGVGGFSAPLGSGPLIALGTFISPWDYLNATGIDSTQANGYMQALLFEPTNPVPEPASAALMLGGIASITFLRQRRLGVIARSGS